jgi:multidrug efflux pump subunit AcrA (membrane-fusion protein)
MSEIHDISDEQTVPALPSVPPRTEEPPFDFGPLIDNETEDFVFTSPPPGAHPSRRKLWITLVSIVVLVLLIGGGVFAFQLAHRPAPVTYTQAAATVGNLTVTVSGTGPIQAGAVYNLNFATSGSSSATIKSIDVHVGEQVQAGQVLATLDPTSLQDAVNQAQDSVNAAQTSLNNAYASLSNAQSQASATIDNAQITEQNDLTNCEKTGTPTGNSGGGSGGANATPTPTPSSSTIANCKKQVQDTYNQAVAQANGSVSNAQNQVNSAQQQLTNAQTQLQTAKDNLKNATLTAPHAGTIEAINGMVGEVPGSGSGGSGNGSGSSGSSSAFIELVDASTLNVAAQINEANIASVAVNQPATFTVAAYPSQTFRASVSSIDTMGTTSSNVVTYLVDLAVNMQSLNGAHVYPGMTATVSITTAERISTLLVPSAALSFSTTAIQNGELTRSQLAALVANRGSSAGGTGGTTGSRGIVVELKNGKLVPVLVTTGLTNGQYTEILSGLREGDQVVVSQTGGTSSTSSSGTNGNGGSGRFGGGGGGGGIFIRGGGN